LMASVTLTWLMTSYRVNDESFCCSCTNLSTGTPSRLTRRIIGVFMLVPSVIRISRRRGIPRVTFTPPCPAKWKVFNVIWVEGSPTPWPAIVPTFSPGWINALCYFLYNMFSINSYSSLLKFFLFLTIPFYICEYYF